MANLTTEVDPLIFDFILRFAVQLKRMGTPLDETGTVNLLNLLRGTAFVSEIKAASGGYLSVEVLNQIMEERRNELLPTREEVAALLSQINPERHWY